MRADVAIIIALLGGGFLVDLDFNENSFRFELFPLHQHISYDTIII